MSYLAAFAIYLMVKIFLNYRKLKEIGAPPEYIKSIALSWLSFLGGVAIIGVIVIVRFT